MNRTSKAPKVWQLSWRVAQHRPREYWVAAVLWVGFFCAPALTGYLLARGYEALNSGNTGATYWWAAGVAASELTRMLMVHRAAILWSRVWVHMQSLLRANMLAAQVASGGPEAGRPVGSAGAALTHFRDDTEDVAHFVDVQIDVAGGVLFTAIAGFVLGSANATAAAVLLIPLVAVAVTTRALDGKIKEYRAADRAATAEVTGLLGDTMAAATTVKVNEASEPMLARLRTLVDRRRETATRDRVLEESVQAFSQGASDVGLGLVLVASAAALASGAFDVATLALFAAYLGWLSFMPRMFGLMLARRKQAAVAFERMSGLVADASADNTVTRRTIPIDPRDAKARPEPTRPARVRLQRLDVVGLTARYPGGAGITDVSFTVKRGEFLVITGPVGSGKSTLLRAILGLAWRADVSGEIRWNGTRIEEPAAFMVPPNAAFMSQVPNLISDSVADNVALGPVDDAELRASLDLAEVAQDVDSMTDGVDTLIGPRGLRLSGGQRQRLATARALVHHPEVVVLDDLSSALDVETELQLWANLADAGMTVIAVSHRAVSFRRATQVLRLEGGRLRGAS